jgi:hypothetical protein
VSNKDIEDLLGSKFDPSGLRKDDLFYDEEKNVEHPVLRIRLVCLGKAGERWEILEDKKVIVTIPAYRFTKKEKKYLYTVDGSQKLLILYKTGYTNVLQLKNKLIEDGLI